MLIYEAMDARKICREKSFTYIGHSSQNWLIR